jgi:hypothetical protein
MGLVAAVGRCRLNWLRTYPSLATEQPAETERLAHPIDALRYCVWQTRNFAHAELGKAVSGIRLY